MKKMTQGEYWIHASGADDIPLAGTPPEYPTAKFLKLLDEIKKQPEQLKDILKEGLNDPELVQMYRVILGMSKTEFLIEGSVFLKNNKFLKMKRDEFDVCKLID